MVNARLIKKIYKCGKCGSVFTNREDAENCCKKEKIDWTEVDKFELKQIHLDLLKRMEIGWNYCEFGAPYVDPKRPYGNSDVFNDIAEIIKLKKKENYDYKEEAWKEKAIDYMEDLHRQMQIVLEIILHCQSFKLGKYKKIDYGKWKFVGD